MPIDLTQTQKEVVLNSGEFILIQGKPLRSLIILHSGTVDILYSNDNISSINTNEILIKSKRIYTISGESFLGEYALINNIESIKTVRVKESAKVSIYPFSYEALLNLPQKNPQLSLFLLKSLQNRIKIAINKLMEINKNIRLVQILKDNLSIIFGDIIKRNNLNSVYSKSLLPIIEKNYTNFIKNNGTLPSYNPESFLIMDNSKFLGKDYDEFVTNIEDIIDRELLNFLFVFLGIDAFTLKGHLKFNKTMFKYPVEVLSETLYQLIMVIYNSETNLLNNINLIISGEDSFANILLSLRQDILSNSIFNNIDFNILLKQNLEKLKGVKDNILPTPTSDKLNEVNVYLSRLTQGQDISRDSSDKSSSITSVNIEDMNKIKNSLKTILKYAQIDEQEEEQFIKLLTEFKQLRDKLDTSPEARRLRRKITKIYWQIYYNAFIKSLKDSDIPLAVKLMFRFGFLDDTLLSEENKLFLLSVKPETYDGEFGIYTAYEWLKLIYEEKKIPSINELGLTYEKFLREEEKSKARKEIAAIREDPIKTKRHKVYYEITQMITPGSRVCAESIATAFPILTDDFITIELKKSFLYKQQIDNLINEIRSIDFSLFYRETVFRTKFRAELINEEVLPDIIILPIYGANIMMWQDLETISKHSKGRFLTPSFFSGDLRKSFILALARFRWEICRSEKGPLWADPVEGGLTGLYFDYINFYKKNSKLSDEAKEKIETHIKNYRSNRERFAHDYLTWIQYESKGISKLNKVLRDIFYRTIPFRKEIREKLMKLPNYSDLANRYKNITNRKIKELSIKYRKYEKDEEGLPLPLKRNLEFYSK